MKDVAAKAVSFTAVLSCPAEALQRASEAGCGVLSVVRSWVRFEGWALKEAGLVSGGWHFRYFVVSGDRLEYFEEKRVKIDSRAELAAAISAGPSSDSDMACVITAGGAMATARGSAYGSGTLLEGDGIIGLNGEPIVRRRAAEALVDPIDGGGGASLSNVTLLRPKGKISLRGASVASAGARKHGGFALSIAIPDAASKRSRYNLVVADEVLCAGWVASIKEAIAASAMEAIKSGLSQALHLQALQSREESGAGEAAGANGSSSASGSVLPMAPALELT